MWLTAFGGAFGGGATTGAFGGEATAACAFGGGEATTALGAFGFTTATTRFPSRFNFRMIIIIFMWLAITFNKIWISTTFVTVSTWFFIS